MPFGWAARAGANDSAYQSFLIEENVARPAEEPAAGALTISFLLIGPILFWTAVLMALLYWLR